MFSSAVEVTEKSMQCCSRDIVDDGENHAATNIETIPGYPVNDHLTNYDSEELDCDSASDFDEHDETYYPSESDGDLTGRIRHAQLQKIGKRGHLLSLRIVQCSCLHLVFNVVLPVM